MPRSRLTWAVVAAVALMWLPPVLDVVLHWPGNLGELLHYLLGLALLLVLHLGPHARLPLLDHLAVPLRALLLLLV